MLPPRDRYDEAAVDAMTSANLYWMRFFAALRMTASLGLGVLGTEGALRAPSVIPRRKQKAKTPNIL